MKNLNLKIKDNSIGWLEWDQIHSSVNLISASLIEELDTVLKEIEEARLKALVLVSKKASSFCHGADIKEIQKNHTQKELQELLDKAHDLFSRFERLECSTIAAIQGPCLGGGLEWALCFDYRLIADSPQTLMGLPEVQLGLIPGFGGCLRLPRLLGLKQSLTLLLTGKSLNPKQSCKITLADEKVPYLILEKRALDLANDIVKGVKEARPKTDYKNRKPYSFYLEKIMKPLLLLLAKQQVLKKTKGFYPAPLKILKLLRKSYGSPVSKKTLEREKEAFCEMYQTSISKNLIRLWLMIKQAKKGYTKEKAPEIQKDIQRVGILGAGIMGQAIGFLFADKGFKVRLLDNKQQNLSSALSLAEKLWKQKKQRGEINSYEFKQKMNNLSGSTHFWGLSTLDLLIEALPENKQLKQELIKEVSKKLSPSCLFASNTSSLRISELAESSIQASHFFGLHFFNPAHKMPLLEISLTDTQQKLYSSSIHSTVKKLGKIPLFVKDSPGFIVNRLIAVYLTEALLLFEEGFEIKDIDHCYRDQFGMPLGPFELMDKIGLDICTDFISQLESSGLSLESPPWTKQLCQNLGLGEKSGQGFYVYKGKKTSLNEKTLELKRADQSLSPSKEKIIQRGIYKMINEGKKLLKEGVSPSEEDIDLALILGMGFPPFLGGPMNHGKNIGYSKIRQELEKFSKQYGNRFKPCF